MSKKNRRHHTAKQKADLIRRHLVEKVAISQICEENGLQPSVFYGWMRQLLTNAETALERGGRRSKEDAAEVALKARIEHLEARVAKKDAVIAELSEEFVKAKKELGEP